MIAAILRAQFLSMRLGARRGAVLGLITGTFWYGLWIGLSCAVGVMASRAGPSTLHADLPLLFLLVFLYWQVIPVFSASMGSALDMRKLLLYPAPHGKLFLVEVLLRLTSAAEMVLVLGGAAAGLAFNRSAGGAAALPRLLAPVLLYVLFNVLLASGMRSVLERLLSRRRVREILAFLMVILWMAPRILVMSGAGHGWLHRVESVAAMLGWPWSTAARAVLGESVSLAMLSLGVWTLFAAWFGRRQFERSLRFDAIAAQATPLKPRAVRMQSLLDGFYRFPSLLWRDPLAAIVEKELRSLSRTPRFRMVFVMGFSFGLMVWLPMVLGRNSVREDSAVSDNILTVVGVYAMTLLGQVSYWNCFGFDRSAAAFYFAAPQAISKTLLGKNLACLVFIGIETMIVSGVTVAIVHISAAKVLETLLVLGVCSLYMLAMGNISSVQYPRALSPERVSQGGASSRFQALIFLLYPLALLPVFLAYLAGYAFNSQVVFAAVMGLAAAIGGLVYWVAMESAVATAISRREQILQDLSKGDGPVSSN
jgi:ABC-2 type transport system permease protein